MTDPTPFVSLDSLHSLKSQAARLSLKRIKRNQALLTGAYHSQTVNRGMDFSEVRLYQPGDDVRNIDWRVTARTRVTHTKCFEEEKEKPVITLLDQRSTMFFGSQQFKSVYAAELCALINWAALKQGDRSGGLVAGRMGIHTIAPGNSKTMSHWLQLIVDANRTLGQASQDPDPSLHDMLDQLKRSATPGTELYIISDFYGLNEASQALLYQMSRHCIVTLLWLVDPLDQHLPKRQLRVRFFNKTNRIGYQKSLWQQYNDRFLALEKQLHKLSQQAPIRIILAETHKASPIVLLRSLYGQ